MLNRFHTYYASPIGVMHISGTASVVDTIEFIDNKDEHHQQHPSSLVDTPLAVECTEQLIQYLQGARRVFELPLHQEGTPFQTKVWNELAGIPFGKTISYSDMARRLGDLKAIRAAASANGKNRIAIIIPCHRVVGSRNDLVGYMGGLWRKKWLLEHENKIAHGVQTLF